MKRAVLFASLLLLSACATQNFKLQDGPVRTVPAYEGTSHFVFWGLGQEKTIDPKEVCGNRKVAQVQSTMTFLNGLFSGLTYGIYSPRNFSIYCD
jgi:hypothetical protein